MGDCQNDRLSDFLEDYSTKSDVLKLPYHGSYQKMDQELLEVVEPKYVIVSTSDNVFEEKLINLLEEKDFSYYVTKDGGVTLTSDGKEIKIRQ